VPQVRVTLAADGFTTAIVVTRAEFEHVTRGLLARTRDIAEQVLAAADLAWDDLDRVLLAGGSTRMPMVRDMLEQASGIRPDWSANPDHVVAHGAAIQADLVDRDDNGALETQGWQETASGMRVTIRDVTSQGLGETYYMMPRPAPDAAPIRQDFNHVIIPRNTPIPARGRHTAGTDPGQDGVIITITQGDSEDPDEVRVVGEQSFPVPVYDKHAPFTTILAYDADQTIYVQLKDDATGELVGTFEITNADNMTPGQVERATDRMRQIDVI
jgi:molecular chaperone DnaK